MKKTKAWSFRCPTEMDSFNLALRFSSLLILTNHDFSCYFEVSRLFRLQCPFSLSLFPCHYSHFFLTMFHFSNSTSQSSKQGTKSIYPNQILHKKFYFVLYRVALTIYWTTMFHLYAKNTITQSNFYVVQLPIKVSVNLRRSYWNALVWHVNVTR